MEKVEILKSIVNSDGIIIRWPKKKEEKRAVLEYLIPDCHEYWVHEEESK